MAAASPPHERALQVGNDRTDGTSSFELQPNASTNASCPTSPSGTSILGLLSLRKGADNSIRPQVTSLRKHFSAGSTSRNSSRSGDSSRVSFTSILSLGFEHVQDAITTGSDRARKGKVCTALLLPAVPLVHALRGNLFARATLDHAFSSFMPTAGSSGMIVMLLVLVLLLFFPRKELRALVDQKYLVVLVPGMFAAVNRCLRDLALLSLPPSTVATAMLSSSLLSAPLQYCAFRKLPNTGQLLLLCAVPTTAGLCLWLARKAGKWELDGGTANALAAAVAAGVCVPLTDILIQLTSKGFTKLAPSRTSHSAEVCRTLIWLEVVRGLLALTAAVLFEGSVISHSSHFNGWCTTFLTHAVVPGAAALLIESFAIHMTSALKVASFQGFEAIVAYALEIVILPAAAFSWDIALPLVVLTQVALAYNLIGKDAIDAAAQGRVTAVKSGSNGRPRLGSSPGSSPQACRSPQPPSPSLNSIVPEPLPELGSVANAAPADLC